jgi:hypothetical protein
MAKNDFTQEERVMFDEVLADFDDSLVIAQAAERRDLGTPTNAARSADRIWVPQPIQHKVYDGIDQTGNFKGKVEMAVPITVNQHKVVPGSINAYELRDGTMLDRIGRGAKSALAGAINISAQQKVALLGSIVDAKAGKASGYDDVADMEALFDEQGVPDGDRAIFYSTRDYNGMTGDLANRLLLKDKTLSAYEKSYIGEAANFDTYKNKSALWLPAATATSVTVAGADQRHMPKATVKDAAGDKKNVDNRFMTLNIAATGDLQVGDAFTIAGVNAVHHKTGEDTGRLKTFRVANVVNSSTIEITPAIICDDYVDATDAETAYKNVTATPASGAAITFLNTTRAYANPAFVKGALEIVPSSMEMGELDGMMTMKATTELGVSIYYSRQGEINDLSCKYRWDVRYGTGLTNTEMAGIQLFNQA